MSIAQTLRLIVNLHTNTIVGLLDAAERADTPVQRAERMAMARDCAIEFKSEFATAIAGVELKVN